jgi:hypothetical protein
MMARIRKWFRAWFGYEAAHRAFALADDAPTLPRWPLSVPRPDPAPIILRRTRVPAWTPEPPCGFCGRADCWLRELTRTVMAAPFEAGELILASAA